MEIMEVQGIKTMNQKSCTRAFSVLGIEFGIISNTNSGVSDNEYFSSKSQLHSLLSNFRHIVDIPFTENHHAYIIINDYPAAPFSIKTDNNLMMISGPITKLEQEISDKRESIFGNMGILSKYIISILEYHGIFSFHSTSFFDPSSNRLYLVLGGSGAGKSTVLLAALEQNFQVFGTELTHISIQNGKTIFHKGSLIQNCRVGNLVEDFPNLIQKLEIPELPTANIWHSYRSVDLTAFAYPQEKIVDPALTIIFPKIESDRKVPEQFKVKQNSLESKIFENLCEKTSTQSYVYGIYFTPSLDTLESQLHRSEFARQFTKSTRIEAVWKSLANPHMCLMNIV
jgi:hypothetical protein